MFLFVGREEQTSGLPLRHKIFLGFVRPIGGAVKGAGETGRRVWHCDTGRPFAAAARDRGRPPGRYASSARRSISTSSAIWPSVAFSSSIRRTPCMMVVWSRPPKRRPISGSDRLVSCLHRYIATWRGRA